MIPIRFKFHLLYHFIRFAILGSNDWLNYKKGGNGPLDATLTKMNSFFISAPYSITPFRP